MLRHIALNSLLSNKDKLTKYADEVVLCLDGKNYWRKSFFPFYKQNRKKAQKKDSFDWDLFHEAFNQLKEEFKENMPYKVLEVETAEADDLMAVLAQRYGAHRDVVIVSSDKDLLQISSRIQRVKQFSPYHKKFIQDTQPYSLFEHIIKGDDGDGVPNIFSADDTFMVEGKRQTPIQTVKLKEWAKTGIDQPEVFCRSEEDLQRLERNRKLVDLQFIPDQLQEKIVQEYEKCVTNNANLFNYLVRNKLKKILERGNF